MIGPTTFSILPKIPSLCLLSWHNYEKQPLSSSKMFQFTNSMVTVLIYTLNLFQFLQIWRWQIPTEYVEFSTVFVTWQTLILSQIIWVSLLPQRSWGETSLHFHRVYKYLMSKFWTHKWVNIHAMPEKFESIEIITRNTKTYIKC